MLRVQCESLRNMSRKGGNPCRTLLVVITRLPALHESPLTVKGSRFYIFLFHSRIQHGSFPVAVIKHMNKAAYIRKSVFELTVSEG